ncbi:MAG: hypothetical protein NPINA01_18070 [Nitrospinaceae bacterium]|nr:MAG: hypothetical protein NPINA01_18070 [Nitrospinaceae bacterium]
MIRQLTNHGFKDQIRTLQLSGLDLITSDDVNGVGKSAVLEAFKLALTGEVPGRAKTVDDILQFTSFDEMKVGVVADPGNGPVSVERGFLRHAPQGEKRPVWIDHRPRKYEEGGHWVRERIGPVSLSFDFFEFLNLSDAKKRQWIIAHSPESEELSQRGLYLLLLVRMVEKYLGSGIIHSLLLSLGMSSLNEIFAVRDANDLSRLHHQLREIFHSQEPKHAALTQKILNQVFQYGSPSESAERNSSAMLKQLKAETLRLKNAVREQTAALSCMGSVSKNDRTENLQNISDCREKICALNKTVEDFEDRLQKTRMHLAEKGSTALKEHEFALRRLSVELRLKRDKHENSGPSHFTCPVARQVRCDTDMAPYREILGEEIEALMKQEAETRKSLSTAKAQRIVKFCQDECTRLPVDSNRMPGKQAEIATLEKEKRVLKAQRDKIQKVLDDHLRQEGRCEVFVELKRKKKQCEEELKIVKQVAELLSGVQEEMASRIAGALETEVNETLKWIDSDHEFILSLRGKQFEMGWNRNGKIIPFNTINSAHFIIFIVPFMVALINRMAAVRKESGLPTLRALCIEAESLTPGNLRALLKGLATMKKRGGIDNVLVAHYHSVRDAEKLFGFQEHILEESGSSVLA